MTPAEDELAAIAAAWLMVSRRDDAPVPRTEPSRWALAGRVRANDAPSARFAARAASRWNAAGRLRG